MKLSGNRCLCGGCGLYFSGTSLFDAHRVADFSDRGAHRRYLTVEELMAKGYVLHPKGFWQWPGRSPLAALRDHPGAAIDPLPV